MNHSKPLDLTALEVDMFTMAQAHAESRASGENYPANVLAFIGTYEVTYWQDPPDDAPPGTPPTQVRFDRAMITRRAAK